MQTDEIEDKPLIAPDPQEVTDLFNEAKLNELIARAERGEQVMEEALELGATMAWNDSNSAFIIGDLALMVTKRYGKNKIAEFAKGIRKGVNSVKDRRTVCKRFPKALRATFRAENPNLYYSHFRTALRVEKKLGLDHALDFLRTASIDDWTVERTGVEADKKVGKEVKPARQEWLAPRPPMIKAVESGSLIVPMAGFDATNIHQFIQQHIWDEELEVGLFVIYKACE